MKNKREYGIVMTIIVVVLSLAWLFYIVACWGGWLFVSRGNTGMLLENSGWIAALINGFSNSDYSGQKTLSIYLHTLPPVLAFILMLVLCFLVNGLIRLLAGKKAL